MDADSKCPVELLVTPTKSLVDDDLDVTLSGLRSWQTITLVAALTTEDDRTMLSHAHYVADHEGCLDLHRSSAHGGSYTGKHNHPRYN